MVAFSDQGFILGSVFSKGTVNPIQLKISIVFTQDVIVSELWY